ncbi:GldG family protein [Gorillibacterium timonense]|uniref:GldG family protein n=1 Tax=Gorillibacterium timonense TaxID=1689269 RepID=UPI00071CD6C6|nr:Gldg family protein [Gorillibacterium timonense]
MKKWIRGTNAVVLSAAVIGIFILLTVFLHSAKGLQWDLTATKKFTLSDQTTTVVKNLKQEVNVIAFTSSSQEYYNRQVSDLLTDYKRLNKKVSFQEVDPKKQPTLAEQYGITQYGTVIFEVGDKKKTVLYNDIFGYGSDQSTYNFSGEEKFTQAIMSLTSGTAHKAYFLTGHGEQTVSNAASFASALESENYTLADLNLVKDGKIPEDAEALFILSPQQDLSDSEAKLVEDYLLGKGKLFFTLGLSDQMDSWKNWDTVLAQVGVKNTKALAVETNSSLSSDPLTIIPEYSYHEITDKLESANRVTIMPASIGLTSEIGSTGYTADELLATTSDGYGKTNLAELLKKQLTQKDIEKAKGDLEGPLALAYAIKDKDSKPKAVVVGNGMFVEDQYLSEQGNKDFALNSVGWLHEDQSSLTIRPREEAQMQQVYLTPRQNNTIFIVTIIVIPALFLLAGGLVWWRRRRG